MKKELKDKIKKAVKYSVKKYGKTYKMLERYDKAFNAECTKDYRLIEKRGKRCNHYILFKVGDKWFCNCGSFLFKRK
jgi:hypothetical protein